MPRWEPHADLRLEAAALELFASRGYDDTTVGDIADRAGVTARTYFRHFNDKREVLFGGADDIRDRIVAGLVEAPPGSRPLQACVSAMRGCEELFRRRGHDYLRRRDAVIESAAELREREGRKLRSLADAMAAELARRGTSQEEAVMVADVAVVLFVHASRIWIRDPDLPFADALEHAVTTVGEAVVPTS